MSYADNAAFAATPAAVRVARAVSAAAVESNQVVRRWVKAVHAAHVRRATFRELNALDDRLLQDIGLHRGALQAVVARLVVD